jgi:cell division protein FtsB
MPSPLPVSVPRLRRWLLIGGALVLLLWLAFFDSHSLLQRYRWHAELEELQQENERLRVETERLKQNLAEPLSDETVERIAREEYGMIRPGETVYRLERK